jgi:hypothetical protein
MRVEFQSGTDHVSNQIQSDERRFYDSIQKFKLLLYAYFCFFLHSLDKNHQSVINWRLIEACFVASKTWQMMQLFCSGEFCLFVVAAMTLVNGLWVGDLADIL